MGSSGCEVAGGERRVVVLEAVCAEHREARESEQTCVLFKILAGSGVFVVRPETKTWLQEFNRVVLWVRVDGPSCLVVAGL